MPAVIGVAALKKEEAYQGVTFVPDLTECKRASEAVRIKQLELARANRVATMGQLYTTKPDGVGIEVSICRSIIEAHGRRLRAEVPPPRGAVHCFTLPAHP